MSITGNLVNLIPDECLSRLLSLKCTAHLATLAKSVAVMGRLPATVHYTLIFYCTNWEVVVNLRIPTTTSSITQFTFGIGNMYREHSSRQALAVLDAVFRRLTLNLNKLAFNKAPSSNGSKPQKFLWSHQTFLDFAVRSELAITLRELSLVGAHISLPEFRATLR
ncbi:F-box domain-containing protein [Mycena chlorophos]|uniref:F-box domain-containing protein n=1 Tax=Mycena chlorophos TaxID=658473 RepID=A0A8H6VYG7_MYCCL|nr:F-box domain-containing protein [Mycena chlorophos]